MRGRPEGRVGGGPIVGRSPATARSRAPARSDLAGIRRPGRGLTRPGRTHRPGTPGPSSAGGSRPDRGPGRGRPRCGRPSRSRWPRWPCPGRCSRRSWGESVGSERRRAPDERSLWAGEGDVEPRRTGMVRREVRGEVEERGVRGPSRRSIEHRARRTPRSCRPIPWTWSFGPSPIGVQMARARSRTARSALIWEIPG